MRFGVAIMAAGKGTRLKSRRPKVLHEIGGKALLLHVICGGKDAGSWRSRIYCIVGHEAERVREAVASNRRRICAAGRAKAVRDMRLQQVKAHFAAEW